VTTPDNEVTTWNRDAEMRVKTITHNDKDGTSTETFGYDANNDVTSHVVTRGGVTSLAEGALYDALGRLYQKQGQHGQTLTYGYDGNGNVLTVTDAVGHSTVNVYDHLDRLVQTTESGGASPPMPSAAPTLNAPSTSTTGSYTVSWTSVAGASTYILQEQVNGGSWNTIQNSSSISWATSGKANATYGYRAQGCNATGCGPWSSVGTTTVLYPPGTPALSVPATSNTGSYTASWSSVGTATSYNLQEQVNGGAWTTVQSSGATSWSATGKANNTYGYQVQACNGSGCSAWSAVSSVAVLLPPGAAPTLTAPSSNASGSYTVSWTSVATATSYTLQQQVNGGSWTTAQSSGAISWNASGESNGTYAYRVAACDAGGCSAWSSTSTTTVLLPPGSPPSVNSPGTNSTGSYTVSWSTITSATTYNLQERVNGGGWTTVQSGSATSWSAAGKANGTYGYQAQSCNSGGCSAWSSVSTTTVLLPPGSAPALTAPGSNGTGGYTVSWTSVSTATSYNLQERLNGGGWTTVQSTGATSWAASGRGNGTYGYQVQACNASGCGPWSGVGSVTVLLPPGSAPSLSVPGSNGTGSYTVSWSNVATATGYNLQEQVNGGGWTTVQSSSSTNWGTSGRGNGTYGYQVQACNASGCGPWSSVGSVTVLLPPGSAPALTVPANNGTGSYTVSWGSVSGASSYNLQQQVNGGSWTTVSSTAATSWAASGEASGSYGYRIQSCNVSGCSGWSATATSVVTIPVPIAINGQTYSTTSSLGSTGGASATIGFEITGGNTWEVFTANQHVANTPVTSGAVPSGAATVQYTWTEVGLANGANIGGGTLTNSASSPTALSSNPLSDYSVSMAKNSTNVAGLTYQVTVTFYNAAGINISSSTCTMTAEVAGTE
jgi:YD repeat-containing protein